MVGDYEPPPHYLCMFVRFTSVRSTVWQSFSTAVAIIFGLLILRGVFHDSIPLLYFLSSGSQLEFRKWRWLLGLEPRNELEEMAPMMAIYPESSPSIASSHVEESHLSILTTPRPLPHVRSADHRF